MRAVELLIVSTTLSIGGAQRFVSNLLHHLDREVVRPSLCLLRDEVGFPVPNDVPVQALSYNRRPWQLPGTVLGLRRLIRSSRPGIVLSNITATNLITGAALRGVDDAPIWVARMGNDPARQSSLLREAIARRVLPRADRVVANSRGLKTSIRDYYGLRQEQVDCLPNPTDLEALRRLASETPAYRKPSGELLMIAVGRLFEQKRYDLMIEAFARVRQSCDVRLWICGEGPARSALENQVGRLGLEGSVSLLGFCENPFPLMRQADLFVMSSDHEGLPNALLEAQALGLPAVTTDCPYGPEEIVVDGLTGVLVPVGDAQALARGIEHLLVDSSLRRQMSGAATESIHDRYGALAVTEQWQSFFRDLVRGGEC